MSECSHFIDKLVLARKMTIDSSGLIILEEILEAGSNMRKPIQARSINTRERIIDAALKLFCEKGYYHTTTNEIACAAEVSIGSLYAYFADKDALFLEILDQYHQKFMAAKRVVLDDSERLKVDPRAWLKALIESLISVHEETKELNRELNVLAYYDSRVAEIRVRNQQETMRETLDYFTSSYLGDFKHARTSEELEAAVIVIFDLISSTVDRIVFQDEAARQDLLVDVAVDMVCQYLTVLSTNDMVSDFHSRAR
jgi:AcrR family transcriptional regulator